MSPLSRPSLSVAAAPFLLPYVVPLAMLAGAATGRLWLFRAVAWVWLAVAILDVIVPPERPRRVAERAPTPAPSALRRLSIRAWLPVQVAVIASGLTVVASQTTTPADLFLITVSIGVAGGMLAVPVAHELMHGSSRFDRLAADVLMLSVSYPHFSIEHVHGHHRRVATPADPATARLGESFYAFYGRTLAGSVASAWDAERARVSRRGRSVWGPANRLVQLAVALAAIYAGIGLAAGWIGVAFFAVQSVIAFSTLETINYIEHYGLLRREIAPGRYEPVRPWHSWDSTHRVSNWMSFNLGRHADHHCHASKRYEELLGAHEAPQLPTGYYGMFLLPLVPPLWRRLMDPRVHAWRESHYERRTA
jgi:alkane 1-monooxygenase